MYKGKFEAEMAAAVRMHGTVESRWTGGQLVKGRCSEAGLSLPPEWSAAPEGHRAGGGPAH